MSKHEWHRGQKHRGQDFRTVCFECGEQFMLSTGWMDAKGQPFLAYYCTECKEKADDAD